MIEQITITAVKSITDEPPKGKFSAQKKIVFTDQTGRTISGWVYLENYVASSWVPGSTISLDISNNGKYTNFKLPKKAPPTMPSPPHSVPATSDEVMMALREIYKLVKEIHRLSTHKPLPEPPYPPAPWGSSEEERGPF